MKKKISLFIVVSLLIAMFSGCTHEEQNTKISVNGKVTENKVYYIDKAAIDTSDGATTTINGKDPTTLPTMKFNGIVCYKDSVTNTYSSVEEYVNALSSENSESVVLAKEIYSATPETLYFSLDSESALALIAFMQASESELKPTTVLSYEFDNPIAQTNGTIDATNPNKVTFTFTTSSMPDEIFVTTSSSVSKEALKEAYILKKDKDVKLLKRVTKLKVRAIKKGKVKVRWKKVKKADLYHIEYSRKKSFKDSKTLITSKKSTVLRGLKRKKIYYFRVKAITNNGNSGKWSNVKRVKVK